MDIFWNVLKKTGITSDMDSVFVVCSVDRSSSWESAMRMSCNGCRVLRKGCSDSCELRSCLRWIRTSESQANATVFLAKFYGRSGLMNLINSGPDYLRPTIFRSLLYEACGRIVNPIYGSVGLLWSGNWHICQAAVESVLKGYPLQPLTLLEIGSPPPAAAPQSMETVAEKLHNVRSKGRFKRPLYRKPSTDIKRPLYRKLSTDIKRPLNNEDVAGILAGSQVCNLRWRRCYPKEFQLISGEPATNFLSTDSRTDSDDLARMKTNYNPIENRAETWAQSEGIEKQSEAPLQNLFQTEDPLQNLFQQNDNNDVENIMRAELTDEKDLELELTLGSSTFPQEANG